MSLSLKFLGTGDAFGHGGRLQPCLFVRSAETSFLVDCGASAMVSLNRFSVDSRQIKMILLSHLHGDHFGGIPFFMLEAQLVAKRTEALVIAGPPGLEERISGAMDIFFPGAAGVKRSFETQFIELAPGEAWAFRDVNVTPGSIDHPSGSPAYAYRLSCCGRVMAYTGDGQWNDSLTPLLRDADVLVAESYFYEKEVKYHLNYKTLMSRMGELAPRRAILVHMSADMLGRIGDLELEGAFDGMNIDL
ncbi:MAG: MBL fold metallo-hydrolase [Deltaproteobacteria bacterium]|nr:MBL fold metallo-hydrolase [Deltaproteobacteria bacterium]